MADSVGLSIQLDIAGALKSLNNFADKGNKSLSSVESSMKSLDRVAKAALAFLAGREIVQGFQAITKSAAESEESLTKMEVALKLAGDFSTEAARGFEEFAAQLQATTTYSDDAVLSSVALAKQFGTTNDQAKRLVSAAADLAAITGESLDSAVSNLGKTLDGTSGRLAEQIPALRNMTAAQLQAGAAIDFVSQRFQGAAVAAGNTYTGSIIKAKNSFDDLLETLGGYVTQNKFVLTAIQASTKLFQDLHTILKENDATIRGIVKSGVLVLIDGFGILIQVVEVFDKALFVVIDSIRAFYRLFSSLPEIISAVSKSIKSLDLAPLKEINDRLNQESADARKPLDARISFYEQLTEAVAKYSVEVEKSGKIQKKVAKDTVDELDKIIERLNSQQRSQFVGAVSQNPFGAFLKDGDGSDQVPSPNPKADTGLERGLGAAAGGILAISKGAEGATKAAAGLVGSISNMLLPGIGAVAGQIFEVLAQGPEQVQAFVRSFAQAIPAIVVNVAKAIPALIEELIRQLPIVIEALVDAVPEIIEAFILGVPDIINALIQSAPRIITTLAAMSPQIITRLAADSPRIITELVKNVPKIVEGFATEFLKIPQQFLDKLLGGIPGVGNILGGGGGGGGIIGGAIGVASGVGGAIGGAIGGLFRESDLSVGSARASSGGSAGIVSEGSARTSDSEHTAIIKMQFGEKELASAILKLNRNGFRVVT